MSSENAVAAGKPDTVGEALSRFMTYQMSTQWPGGIVTFTGPLKPVGPDLEPVTPKTTEDAVGALMRSASKLIQFAGLLGWDLASHPFITIGGETVHFLDGSSQFVSSGEITLEVAESSMGADGFETARMGVRPTRTF